MSWVSVVYSLHSDIWRRNAGGLEIEIFSYKTKRHNGKVEQVDINISIGNIKRLA